MVYNEQYWLIAFQALKTRNMQLAAEESIRKDWYFEHNLMPFKRHTERTRLVMQVPNRDGTVISWELNMQCDKQPAAPCPNAKLYIAGTYHPNQSTGAKALILRTLQHLWRHTRSINSYGQAWIQRVRMDTQVQFKLTTVLGGFTPLANTEITLAYVKLSPAGPAEEWRTKGDLAEAIAPHAPLRRTHRQTTRQATIP